MSPKRILIVGAGERVRDAVLPALARAGGLWELGGVFARSARTLEAHGTTCDVRPLDTLTAGEVEAADLVYLVVGKPAVGAVLDRLARHDVGHLELMLETPVVLFRHLHHTRKVAPFRRAWVAEDCCALPWLELAGAAGRPRRVLLDRSGYAYHGVAMSKAILGSRRVLLGRRRRAAGVETRTLRLAGGGAVEWVSPRDYSAGRVVVTGERGALSDSPRDGELHLAPLVEGGRCVGARAGDAEVRFDDDEAALSWSDDAGASLIARMQDMKRIGLLRLFRRLHAGEGAYPLAQGVDDMVVDYHLEKLGAYAANPVTSAGALGRPLLELGLRLAGR